MAPLALDDEAIELVVTTDGDVVPAPATAAGRPARRDRGPRPRRAGVRADRRRHAHVRGRDPKARLARPREPAAQAGRADPMTDFFDDLERELRRAHRRDTESHARSRVFDRRRLPGLLATGRRTLVALAVVAALVAVVVTVARESDVERPAAPPGKKVVATDVERGVRFSLDGRVLTVQLLPPVRNQTFETVSGARDQRDLRRERRRAAG